MHLPLTLYRVGSSQVGEQVEEMGIAQGLVDHCFVSRADHSRRQHPSIRESFGELGMPGDARSRGFGQSRCPRPPPGRAIPARRAQRVSRLLDEPMDIAMTSRATPISCRAATLSSCGHGRKPSRAHARKLQPRVLIGAEVPLQCGPFAADSFMRMPNKSLGDVGRGASAVSFLRRPRLRLASG